LGDPRAQLPATVRLIVGERFVRGLVKRLAIGADEPPGERSLRKRRKIVNLERLQITLRDTRGARDLVEGDASPLPKLAKVRTDRRHTSTWRRV